MNDLMLAETIAVVILNYKNYELTETATKSLIKLNENIRIIIVDNCSPNESYKVLKDTFNENKNIDIIKSPENLGYATGNNYGVRYLIEKYPIVDKIVIMNPDVIVDDFNVFKKLSCFLDANPNAGAVTSRTYLDGVENIPFDCAWKYVTKKQLLFEGSIFSKKVKKNNKYYEFSPTTDGFAQVDVVQGCFFMIKKENFEKVDFFDERTFLYYEECILAEKLAKINLKNFVDTSSFIYHNHNVKNKNLKNYNAKKFDSKCYFESKKILIKFYTNYSNFFKLYSCIFLSINYFLKKIYYKFHLK